MKLAASEYADPYRRKILVSYIQCSLRQIPYLQNIDALSMDEIFYTLKREKYSKNKVIFEKGAVSNRVFIVLEGRVSLVISLYDQYLQS